MAHIRFFLSIAQHCDQLLGRSSLAFGFLFPHMAQKGKDQPVQNNAMPDGDPKCRALRNKHLEIPSSPPLPPGHRLSHGGPHIDHPAGGMLHVQHPLAGRVFLRGIPQEIVHP
jgi:hypothetical protein